MNFVVGKTEKSVIEASFSSNKRIKLEEAEEVEDSENHFDRLPDEMVEMILALVQTPSRETKTKDTNRRPYTNTNIRLVCPRWNKLTASKFEYKGEIKDSTIHSFARLSRSIKFKALTLSALQFNRIRGKRSRPENVDSFLWNWSNSYGGMDYDRRIFKRSVEHLIVGGEAAIFLRKYGDEKDLPFSLSTGFAEDHKRLRDVLSSIKGADLVNIVSQIKDVKTLTLSSIAFLSVSKINLRRINFSLQFSVLTTLDLCVGRKTDPVKLAVLLENATFPVLSSFYVRIYLDFSHFSLLVRLYLFISKHPRLQNLSFSQAQTVYGVPSKDCEYSSLQISAYPGIEENLMKIKLKCLRMDALRMEHHALGQQWEQLELAFIKNQTSLKGLELQVHHRGLVYRLDEILPACGETLERLELSSWDITPNHFDCSTLSSFSKLKDCHLYLRNNGYIEHTTDVHVAKMKNIHLLPGSIESLHLGRLPSRTDLGYLQERMVKLKRVSYNCADILNFRLTPCRFVQILRDHLKFTSLTEYRMYQYACPTVTEFLHRQDGLVSYIEDDDTVVVLIDKKEFVFEKFLKCTSVVPNCIGECCMQHY